MRKPLPTLRAVAVLLSFALVHASFGTQAWAQVVSVGAVSAPVGGAASAAASINNPSLTPGAGVSLMPSGASLTGSFTAPVLAPAPAVVPSASLSAPAALPVSAPVAAAAELGEAASARSNNAQALTAGAKAAASKEETPAPGVTPAASPASAPAESVETGPKTKGVAARANAIIAGVRRIFGGKSAETLPAASAEAEPVEGVLSAAAPKLAAPMASDESAMPASNEPPAPPQQPNDPAPKKKGGFSWFGLGAVAMGLIGGMLVMQLGLEAQGAAMAQLTEDAFGDFSILAQVAIFASIGSMVGQQLSQFFSSKIGLTKTFYAAHMLRAVSLATMIVLLGTGHMALPLMFAFYALNGIVTGVAVTAEGTLRKFLLIQQGVSQQKFRTWWQLLAETIAVPAPMILGSLVLTLGASWITAIYPATIVLGLLLFLMLKIIPLSAANRIENAVADAGKAASGVAAKTPAPDAPKVGPWQRIKNAFATIFNNMEGGKEFVFKNPVLKYSLLAATIFDLMNVIIYRLIAPGYAKLVAGSAGMSAVQGNLVGMFSLGGLLLAVTFLVLEKISKKKAAAHTPAENAAAERSSMLRWSFFGIPALGLLGVMAFNIALPLAPLVLFGTNWMPGTMLGAMLIPFGFMQVASSIKLNSYFQDRLPEDSAKVQKAIAFSGSAMTALSIVLMLALKPLFGDLSAFNPFPYMAGALIPLAAGLFFIWKKLSGATKPEALKLADVPVEQTAGGWVGILLGVVTAALVLSAVGMIPATAALMAGLGILGKFLVTLGIALALPAAGFFVDRKIRARAGKK